MQDKSVQDVYNSYFRFNNQRTLSTELPSELSVTEADGYSILVDKTRRYDNQIIIQDICKIDELEQHLQWFSQDCPPEISIEPQANTNELQSWLSSLGFAPIFEQEFLQLLSSDYVPSSNIPETISIERWGANHADEFLALLKTSGLECSDAIWQKRRSLYCTDTFRCYVAKLNGRPCAWATSFIEQDHAILANAYTQEDSRSQGCQTALLRARIEDAITLGVKVLLTDVMPNSTSCHNCQSVGFRTIGIRSVWGKD